MQNITTPDTDCKMCHLDADGACGTVSFTSPEHEGHTFGFQVLGGNLRLEYAHNGKSEIVLGCPIKYCPFCGREIGTGEDIAI